jgi:hypothetical protein
MSEKCRKSSGIIQSPDPRMTDGPTIIPANHLVFHFGELPEREDRDIITTVVVRNSRMLTRTRS